METKIIFTTLFFIHVLCNFASAFADQIAGGERQANLLISELQKSSWQERSLVLKDINSIYESTTDQKIKEKIKIAYLHILGKEMKDIKKYYNENPDAGEGRAELFLNTTRYIVDNMSKDPRIIVPVIDSFEFVSGKVFQETVANFGDQALDSLIFKYNNIQSATDVVKPDVEHDIILTIKLFFEKGNLSTDKTVKAKEFLLKTLKNNDIFTRIYSIEALECLSEPDLIPYFEDIALNDPYVLHKLTGEKVYTVRDRAKKAIEKLKQIKNE